MFDTIFFAKFLGVLYTVLGLSMIINGKNVRSAFNDVMNNHALQVLAGAFPLALGTFILLMHNTWEGNWHVQLITLIGWILVMVGAFRLLATSLWISTARQYVAKVSFPLIGILCTLFGLTLLYIGYGV